jgi:hypothetical protein
MEIIKMKTLLFLVGIFVGSVTDAQYYYRDFQRGGYITNTIPGEYTGNGHQRNLNKNTHYNYYRYNFHNPQPGYYYYHSPYIYSGRGSYQYSGRGSYQYSNGGK